jgi:hypothetical protein
MSRLFREGSRVARCAFVLLSAIVVARAEPDVQAPPKANPGPTTFRVEGPALPALEKEWEFLSSICREIGLAAAAYNLPAGFLAKLIWQESRFDPRAVSRAGAQGIAQFMPGTARWRGLVDPFDPHRSVRESARWLGELRSQFGNLGLAAAAYNAGPKRVQEWLDGKRGLPPETQAYVRIISGRLAEEWARPGKKDHNSFLPAAPDCRTQELIQAAAFRALRGTRKRPDEQQKLASKRVEWSLQLIGDHSEARALGEYRSLQKKFPSILGERSPLLIKRQLGGRGPAQWYQVRVAEQSRDAANALCSRLKSAGGQCLVLNN